MIRSATPAPPARHARRAAWLRALLAVGLALLLIGGAESVRHDAGSALVLTATTVTADAGDAAATVIAADAAGFAVAGAACAVLGVACGVALAFSTLRGRVAGARVAGLWSLITRPPRALMPPLTPLLAPPALSTLSISRT